MPAVEPPARTVPSGFVICHHPQDEGWGLYLRQEINKLGIPTRIQSRDIEVGRNIVATTNEWLRDLEGAIVVVSAHDAGGAQRDVWTAAHAEGKRVVPVCVDGTVPAGMLAGLNPLRLDGRDEAAVQRQLSDALRGGTADAPVPMPRGPGAGTLPVGHPHPLRWLLDRFAPRLHLWLTLRGFLRTPPELPALREHLQQLHARLRQELHERSYVPLDGVDVPDARSAPGSREDPFVRPVQQLIRQVLGSARGGDGASAQLSASSHGSEVVRDIASAVLRSREPIVLLGDPGSGKTMTLQNAVLAVVEQELRRVYPVVPVFVRLGDFHVPHRQPRPDDVRQFVLRRADAAIAMRWSALDAQRRLMVFFDGMDEMSRDRYGKHVEALSLFAGAAGADDTMRTLFSCRINDFSPEFRHRRMVLLPFERAQLRDFLQRYVPRAQWPLRIDGTDYTPRALADKLWHGDMPVEPRNPFVLWLLLFYLRAKGSWPQSRPALLAFFARRSLERKRAEAGLAEEIDALQRRPFVALGQLGFLLMRRNLGTSADVATLRSELPGIDVQSLVSFGQRCGLLALSTGPGQPQVRFAHHRLAEFFAARHIHHAGVVLDWMALMEAPRWQETLLNVTLMGRRDEPVVQQLASAIGAEVQGVIAARTAQPTRAAMSADAELLLADRVDLLARLLRQRPLAEPFALEQLAEGIAMLANWGNPSTQVKMLWAWKNVPQAEVGDHMVGLLDSPIAWVRDQALMLVADSPEHQRQLRTDPVMQLGMDLARGELVLRWANHAKAAARERGGKGWTTLGIGLALALVWMGGLLATSFLLFRASSQLPNRPLADWLGPWTYGGAVAAAATLALLVRPGLAWLSIGGTAAGLCLLATMWREISTASLADMLLTCFGLACAAVCAVPLLALLAWAWHSVPLVLLSCVRGGTQTLRQRSAILLACAGTSCRYRELVGYGMDFVKGPIISMAAVAIILAAATLLFGRESVQGFYEAVISWAAQIVESISRWTHLPFSPWMNIGCLVLAALAAAAALTALVGWSGAATGLAAVAAVAAIYVLGGYIVFGGPLAAALAWIDAQLGGAGAQALLASLGLVLLVLLAWLTWQAAQSLALYVDWLRRPYPPNSIRPADWRTMLGKATSARSQALVFERSSHQALGLDPARYLDELRAVEPLVRPDPSAGAYWRQRHELEQMLRQEQQGRIGST